MKNQKTKRKKCKRSFQYVRMPVSRLKRIKSPKNIIVKYNSGNKDSKTAQRKKRVTKNSTRKGRLPMAKPGEPAVRQQQRGAVEAGVGTVD